MGKESKTRIPRVDYDKCALYTPGHQVHFIQAKLMWNQNQYQTE